MKACLSFDFEREAHFLAISKTKSPIGVILGEVKFLWSLKTQGGGLRLADAVQGQANGTPGRDAAPSAGAHPEHVVPCAFIRDLFLNYFESRKLVVEYVEDDSYAEDLARILDRIIGVVHISQDQKKVLDANGENSMKIKMPENWNPLTGDIFARLTTHGWNVTTPESLRRW